MHAVKSEGQAPVAADPYRVMSGQIAAQRVQFPAGNVHVGRADRLVQSPQLSRQSGRVMWPYAGLAAPLEKLFKAFVPKRFYHVTECIAYLYADQAAQRGLRFSPAPACAASSYCI